MYLSHSSLEMQNRNLGFGYRLVEVEGGGGKELLFDRYPLNVSSFSFFSSPICLSLHTTREEETTGKEWNRSLSRALNIPSGGIKQTLGKVFTFSQSTSTSHLSNSLIRSSVGIVISDPLSLPCIPSPMLWEEVEEDEDKGGSY